MGARLGGGNASVGRGRREVRGGHASYERYRPRSGGRQGETSFARPRCFYVDLDAARALLFDGFAVGTAVPDDVLLLIFAGLAC